jgi:hypothetical protein
LAVSLAYPSGEKGGKFLVQMISTWLRNTTGKGGGGGQHPVVMIYSTSAQTLKTILLKIIFINGSNYSLTLQNRIWYKKLFLHISQNFLLNLKFVLVRETTSCEKHEKGQW